MAISDKVLDKEIDFKVGDKVFLFKSEQNSRCWNSDGDMDHWVETEQIISQLTTWAGQPAVYFKGGGRVGTHNREELNYWTWTSNMFRVIKEKKTLKLKLKI